MPRRIPLAFAVLLAACGAVPTATALPSGAGAAEESPSASPSASPTPTPETASDMLSCRGPVSEVGGRADDFGPFSGGATSEEAVRSFVEAGVFVIPREGYRLLGETGDRSAWIFERDGEAKIVLVVSRRFGPMAGFDYTVEEIRTCEATEFGAADLGPERRAWVHEGSGDSLVDIMGPSHCGWQTGRMLHVEPEGEPVKQYLRDPDGVFGFAPLLETYAEGVEMPGDATDSGYRSPEGFELWFTQSDRAAYVVTPGGIERWPRSEEPIGCA